MLKSDLSMQNSYSHYHLRLKGSKHQNLTIFKFLKVGIIFVMYLQENFYPCRGVPVNKIKTLVLAMSSLGAMSVTIPVHAATDAEVNALRDEVKELKQLVQKLSDQQKQL